MKNTDQSFTKAARLHQKGNLKEAEALYAHVLSLAPNQVDALRLLGVIYLQTGRSPEAIETFEKAHKIAPQNAEILINLGVAYRNVNRYDNALACYENAIKLAPTNAMLLNNYGAALQETGQVQQALVKFILATQINPNYAEAFFNMANLYRKVSQGAKSIPYYKRVLKLVPNHTEAHINLGIVYYEQGQLQDALAENDAVLSVDPDNIMALNNKGNILREFQRYDEAFVCYNKALALNPNYVDAIINKGTSLRDTGHTQEAIAYYDKALSLVPTSVSAHINRGTACIDTNSLEEAITHYDAALQYDPNSVDAKWNKSLVLLGLGNYDEGWDLYDVGYGRRKMRGAVPYITKRWQGEDLSGKTILLWEEQGLGDSLQFVRYAELCKKLGATVWMQARKPLARLFEQCPFVDRVVDKVDEGDFDYQNSLMSLPHVFKTQPETIPASVPYLFPASESREKWSTIMAGSEGIKVGLVWAGNPREAQVNTHLTDKRRSLHLSSFRPFLDLPNINFYSLQVGKQSSQIAELGLQDKIIDFTSEIKDFSDTAAFAEHLDLVVSVDTSVVHLVGGIAKPVWVLSRKDACWRWFRNRETSPWYPTARVFGQQTAGDWDPVIEKVQEELALYVK